MQLFSSATGSAFLVLYTVLLALCGAAAWAIATYARPAGRRGEALDAEGAALLAGGRTRLAETVMADLYLRGGLAAEGGRRLAVARRNLPASPAGRSLLALEGPVTTRNAAAVLEVHADRGAARLRRGGLLMRPDDHLRLRWCSVIPFLALLLVGLYRLRAAAAAGEPTGVLALLLGLTALLAVLRFARSDPHTRAGLAVLAELRAQRGGSAPGAGGNETAMAVALHGTAVLAGTPWEALHALRRQGEGGAGEAGGALGWGGTGDGCDAGGGDGGGCGD